MTDIHKRARIAGAIYLVASLPAFFAFKFVQDVLFVKGDPAATFAHIRAQESLFRLGIGAELLGSVLWVGVIWSLWRLLGEVDRRQSWLMVALGLMTTPISFVAVGPELAVAYLISDPHYAAAFPPAQLQQLAALMLRLHNAIMLCDELFWGVWLFPFGVLVWKSGFLPKLLGALLVAGGVGWIVDGGVAILAPSLVSAVSPWASGLAQIGELPILFWLLIMGARTGFGAPARLAPAAA